MTQPNVQHYWTLAEASPFCRLAPETLRRLAREKKIPATKIQRQYLLTEEQIQQIASGVRLDPQPKQEVV